DPHLTKELNGTEVKYWLRNQNYLIYLSVGSYSIRSDSFLVSDKHPFAVNINENKLEYFNGNNNLFSLKVLSKRFCSVDILNWEQNSMIWKETCMSAKDNIYHEIHNLKPNEGYRLFINNKPIKKYISNLKGMISFDYPAGENVLKIQRVHTKG
ncbi:MAG: hypothetical protein ACRDE2_01860, partial [Chitinophagaceae bacterium]